MNYSTVKQQLLDYRPILTNFIRGRLRNLSDAEDIVQSTYESAFKSITKFRGASSPGVWLTGIAINVMRNTHRQNVKDEELFCPMYDSVSDLTADTRCKEPVEILSGQNDLTAAFSSLTKKQQKLLWMVFVDGLDYQQAADKLGVPLGTIKSRINRARGAIILPDHH